MERKRKDDIMQSLLVGNYKVVKNIVTSIMETSTKQNQQCDPYNKASKCITFETQEVMI